MPVITLPSLPILPTPHATASDYAHYSGLPTPDDIDRKLVRASQVVDSYVTTPYEVGTDETGVAVDLEVKAALRDATCAVVEAWATTDEVGDVQSGGLESGPGREPTPSSLPVRAWRHLADAGLI